MVGDSLRSLLLEMQGYKADVLEFVSSRCTDKNIMIRAHKKPSGNPQKLKKTYEQLQDMFHITPQLERYLRETNRYP